MVPIEELNVPKTPTVHSRHTKRFPIPLLNVESVDIPVSTRTTDILESFDKNPITKMLA